MYGGRNSARVGNYVLIDSTDELQGVSAPKSEVKYAGLSTSCPYRASTVFCMDLARPELAQNSDASGGFLNPKSLRMCHTEVFWGLRMAPNP
jgi:hypothetical protein